MGRLAGRIALVTGASRGIGLGIAHELGLEGAIVYVSARSHAESRNPEGLPGTVEETAALVTDSGGEGIPVVCDHSDDDAILALAERIRQERGHLDLLVNCAWAGYEQYDPQLFYQEPWEQPIWRWDRMFTVGVRAAYVTSRAMIPLLLESHEALIVNISAGDNGKFLGDVQYDVAKSAVDRLGVALAARLQKRSVAVVTVHPGFTTTERVLAVAPEESLAAAHTPRFVGRCVVSLAVDPRRLNKTGKVFKAGQLGLDYNFPDVDGSQPVLFEIPDQV